MDHAARNHLEHSFFQTRARLLRAVGATALSAAISLSVAPAAVAAGYDGTFKAAPGWTPVDVPSGGESGAVTGAGFGPTLGVGGPSSYTGGSTSNSMCHSHCTGATLGVGGPSSYTGGSTVNNPGGTATAGVGDVNSYTGGGTPGTAHNGTNSTTRTGNYGPGHP